MRILVLLFLIFGISEAEINRGMRLVMEKEPKIAFLVANSQYRQSQFFRDLKNPKNDVQAIAKKLKKLGFRVMTGYNLSDIALQKKLKRFYSFLKRAENGVGLFYYAGHGIEVGGVNYLIPSDINVEEAEYVPYRATPLNPIIEKMEKTGKRLNIAVLDACRENPFESRGGIHKGGLASFSASGTFIAYSAESGKMASDGKGKFSPFAKAFLKHIEKPQKIEEFFKDVRRDVRVETHKNQTPATYNLIDGDFYFVLPKNSRETSYFPQKVSNYSKPKKHRLYISTTPNNARVRIMNINPKYRDGIDLGTDKALVEVTKSGYRKYLKWHRNLKDNAVLDIRLERKKHYDNNNWHLAINKWSDRFDLGLPRSKEELKKVRGIFSSGRGYEKGYAKRHPNKDISYYYFANIVWNRITYIPKEIGNMTNLKELDLHCHQIKEIPKEIGNLTKLTYFEIYDGGQIEKIPSSIGNLTNLTKLHLRLNQIKEIPPSIGNLTNLITLNLGYNQIKEIPSSIGYFTNLTYLSLNNNQIKEIPSSIGYFTNLTYLGLYDNPIKEIPTSIGNLINLKALLLTKNQIKEIPISLNRLTKLRNFFNGSSWIDSRKPSETPLQFLHRALELK